jgi:hypothetical protein
MNAVLKAYRDALVQQKVPTDPPVSRRSRG